MLPFVAVPPEIRHPDIHREITAGILQKIPSELRIRQVDVFVHREHTITRWRLGERGEPSSYMPRVSLDALTSTDNRKPLLFALTALF